MLDVVRYKYLGLLLTLKLGLGKHFKEKVVTVKQVVGSLRRKLA